MNRLLLITPYHFNHPNLKRYAPLWFKLAQAQTKIRVLCQYRGAEFSEPPVTHKNIEWLQPFVSYGVRDIASLTRIVYDFKPDLTQLTFDPNENMRGWAYWTAPELIKNVCSSQLITSVHGEISSSMSLLLKYWMEVSRWVWVDSDSTQALLQAQSRPGWVEKVQVAPPPPVWLKTREPHANWLSENFDQWIYAPGEIHDFEMFKDLLAFYLPWLQSKPRSGLVIEVAASHQRLIVLQQLKNEGVEAQVVVLTPRNEMERWQIMNSCSALSLRHLSATNLDVRDWVLGAVAQNKPLFANPSLFSLSKILKSAEVLNLLHPSLLQQSPAPDRSLDHIYEQLEEEIGNTYLRLYQRALI